MRKQHYYKHVSCTDMIVMCLRAIDVPGKPYVKVKVSYHFTSAIDGSPIPHGETEEIKIGKADLPKWRPYVKEGNTWKSL